jgi:hypothetical protein
MKEAFVQMYVKMQSTDFGIPDTAAYWQLFGVTLGVGTTL